jgi:hypothetical protein
MAFQKFKAFFICICIMISLLAAVVNSYLFLNIT